MTEVAVLESPSMGSLVSSLSTGHRQAELEDWLLLGPWAQ